MAKKKDTLSHLPEAPDTVSSNECTGLVPAMPDTVSELKSCLELRSTELSESWKNRKR